MISQNLSTISFSKYEQAFHGGYKVGLIFHKMVLKVENVIAEIRIHYTTSDHTNITIIQQQLTVAVEHSL